MKLYSFLCLLLFWGCNHLPSKNDMATLLENSPSINGNPAYLNSPMVTAGNRLYMVGHQNGTFPDLGWHIKGEMGGIWNHPIKLLDGFEISVSQTGEANFFKLDNAKAFTNYPFANKHLFHWEAANIEIERWQFVPDDREGLVMQLRFRNPGKPQKITLDFTAISDLRPTWLGERTGMVNGKDIAAWNDQKSAFEIKDGMNEWYTVFGAERAPIAHQSQQIKNTTKNTATYELEIGKDETTLTLFVSGSYTSKENALETYDDLQKQWPHYLLEKQKRYQGLAQQSKLTTPDTTLNQTFEWLKYNCDWLVRSVPEIGTAIGAGIPDYPWWFGVDSEYALQGYMAIGQTDPVYATIALLDSVSDAVNGNGKIIHEMSTNGSVFNPGNINETPQFASLIWKIYQWNGDEDFLKRYFPTIEKGLTWLMEENDKDGNLFPDGFGMMEIHGMDSEMIDVAAYTQKAFSDAAEMAAALDKNELSKAYKAMALQLKEKINTAFWSEDFNSYADFIGTDAQALKLIEDAIVRADTLQKPWAMDELKQTRDYILEEPSTTSRPFVLHHNWVVNTPMEVGIAPKEKALKALVTAEKFTNPFGVFVTGIDRDESAGSDDGSFKGSKVFSYTGAVMTLPTGVQAIAENNYGRPDKALNYLKRMTRTFSYALPGSMYEVSPDYGMMTQAWNIYSFAVPIVEQFFGIQPNAAQKSVTIHPQMPSTWQEASLENVKVGENEISMYYSNSEGTLSLKIEQTDPQWTLHIKLKKTDNSKLIATPEGATLEETSSHYLIQTQGSSSEISITYE